jgi:CRP/FNR family transcriptional regulator
MSSAQSAKARSSRPLGLQALFSTLPAAIIADLESRLFVTRYGRGSVIYRQGERPHGIFLVFAGRIKMSAVALHAKTALLKIAGPGEVLNLAACLGDEPHLTTAEATQMSSVGFLPREGVISAMQKHPSFCKTIAQHPATKCMERGREMLLLRVPSNSSQRLASTLLRLGDSSRNGSSGFVDLNYTHAELGQLIGASRETVSRLMKRLENRSLIKTDRSSFIITDQDLMKELGGN